MRILCVTGFHRGKYPKSDSTMMPEQKAADKDDKSNSIYFQSARLVTHMVLKVKNKLPSKKTVKYELRLQKTHDSKISDIKTGAIFYNNDNNAVLILKKMKFV